MQEVKERRGKVSRYLNDPEFKKQVDEDKRARFKVGVGWGAGSCSETGCWRRRAGETMLGRERVGAAC